MFLACAVANATFAVRMARAILPIPKARCRFLFATPGNCDAIVFGLKTADFLICRECGVYIGALLENGKGAWFTVNANSFRDQPPPDFPAVPHDFDSENLQARIARRKLRWTPVPEFAIHAG